MSDRKRLMRLYDLAINVMTNLKNGKTDSFEFADILVEKGIALMEAEGQKKDALTVYDQALDILGCEALQTEFDDKDAREFWNILIKKGVLLMRRGQKAGSDAKEFVMAFECFEQSCSIAKEGLDQNGVDIFYLRLSANILENKAVIFYKYLHRPNDVLQKLEESLARRFVIVGPSRSEMSGTLEHLWLMLDKTDETIDEQVLLRCSSVGRIYQILCKQRVFKALSCIK